MTILLLASLGLLPQAEGVGIDQQLGTSVTMDAIFRDERGERITLREAADGKPMLLALVYYRCPMLCTQILNGLLESLVGLGASAGQGFSVVTVSFDPREGPELAAARRAQYLKSYGSSGKGISWRFLTGTADATRQLCNEAGFRVRFDPKTDQYAHASALLVLTAQGRISRYFMGVSYPPRDLRLSLVEASDGKIGRFADKLLLLCFQYDPSAGKYTLAIWNLLRVGAVVTVLALVALLVRLNRLRRNAEALNPGSA